MNTVIRRILGYGLGGMVAAALVWGGFLYRPSADLWTLLSAIDTQLRLAYVLPAVNKQGESQSERTRMLDDVEEMLDQASDLDPDFAPIGEYRGFLAFMRGDYRGAAEIYRQARDMRECSRDMSDSLVFNEARMLRKAGEQKAALNVLEESRGSLQSKYLDQADLDRASLLIELDRDDEAVRLAHAVAGRGAEHPVAAVKAGQIFEDLQMHDAADSAYQTAAVGDPTANYYRSRLKAGRGEVDSALDLLEQAVQSAPATVRRLAERDGEAWAGVSETERFQRIIRPEESAVPGR